MESYCKEMMTSTFASFSASASLFFLSLEYVYIHVCVYIYIPHIYMCVYIHIFFLEKHCHQKLISAIVTILA